MVRHVKKQGKKKIVRKSKARVVKVDKIRRVTQTKKGLRLDAKRKALPPGKRISKNGNVYYERRSNHSDKNAKKRL